MDKNIVRRKLSTHQLIPVMKELLAQGKSVTFKVTGGSMVPFLVGLRDLAVVSPVTEPLKKGDIVFYQRSNGDYVMHRICKIKNGEYYMVGDAQTEIEGPLKREQIFGVINTVIRKGEEVKNGETLWNLFKYLWLWFRPVRRIVLKIYGFLMK